MHALGARALSEGLCVARADQKRLRLRGFSVCIIMRAVCVVSHAHGRTTEPIVMEAPSHDVHWAYGAAQNGGQREEY